MSFPIRACVIATFGVVCRHANHLHENRNHSLFKYRESTGEPLWHQNTFACPPSLSRFCTISFQNSHLTVQNNGPPHTVAKWWGFYLFIVNSDCWSENRFKELGLALLYFLYRQCSEIKPLIGPT